MRHDESELSLLPPSRRLLLGLLIRLTSSWGLPAIFFLLTVASSLFVGGFLGLGYWSPDRLAAPPTSSPLERILLHVQYGAPFAVTVLAIIFSHEMGHYFAARRYHVDSTLPFFVPFPFALTGTLGAFILIKSRFPHRKALFDVGVAGPFAGFLVAIPALVLGISTSRPGPPLPVETSITFGEPLFFQWLAGWIWPEMGEGQVLYVSPVGIAAWFGLLLTALNLLPVGQLDGGHATYALLRTRAHRVSAWVFFAFLPMTYFGPSWLIWALLLYLLGIRRPHPPTLFDDAPPPGSRYALGIAALAVFVVCFTPEPIEFPWQEVWEELSSWIRSFVT